MRKNKITQEERDDGSYVVKKTKKSSVFAFVVCVLIAFFVWAYVKATDISYSNESDTANTSETVLSLIADEDRVSPI